MVNYFQAHESRTFVSSLKTFLFPEACERMTQCGAPHDKVKSTSLERATNCVEKSNTERAARDVSINR